MNLLLLAGLLLSPARAQLGGNMPVPPLIGGPGSGPTLGEVSRETARGNEIIQSIAAAHGSNPATWVVPVKAYIPPRIVPMTVVGEEYRMRMAYLVDERKRLKELIGMEGGMAALQGIINLGAYATPPTWNTPGERDDSSISAYLAVKREIEEMEQSGAVAHPRYVESMARLGVAVPVQAAIPKAVNVIPARPVPWSRNDSPAPVQAAPRRDEVPQVRQQVDCSHPIVEDSVDYVLVPIFSYHDANGDHFNQIWKRIPKRVVSYPDGCR